MTQPTTHTATAPAPAAQGSHHFILTLQASHGSGFQVFTTQGNHTPAAAWTRQDFYEQVRSSVVREHPELSRANVLFFDVQPNRL